MKTLNKIKKYGEVFTPNEVVKQMVENVKEYIDLSNSKILEPSAGKGAFIDELQKYTNNITAIELQKDNYNYLVDNYKNIRCINGDALKHNEEYDLIIGNPPYNKENLEPLYTEFIEYYYNKCNVMCYIIPCRWMGMGKQSIYKFREYIISKRDIILIYDYNTEYLFNNVVIEGGVMYFIKKKGYNGECKYIIRSKSAIINDKEYKIDYSYNDLYYIKPIYYNLIDSIKEELNKYGHLDLCKDNICRIDTNDKRFKDKGDILVYVSYKYGYIKYINNNENNIKIDSENYVVIRSIINEQPLTKIKCILPNEKELWSNTYTAIKSKYKDRSILVNYLNSDKVIALINIMKSTKNFNRKCLYYVPDNY